ncbi:GL11268 [Drosophila persimilis]|uniref:GL11268 n=1 Tax=Drosophila persimilis TaxID=7234 RepID=B4HA87_DROPE|nr:GL11268 [Drosophila persimilis]
MNEIKNYDCTGLAAGAAAALPAPQNRRRYSRNSIVADSCSAPVGTADLWVVSDCCSCSQHCCDIYAAPVTLVVDLANVVEKGILKKHGYGLVHGEQLKDKWGDDNQSDNLELITQDGTLASTSGGVAASEVERTLKSLNGYHEDILEALRNAATHRGTGTR